jgi:phage terminase small subunit
MARGAITPRQQRFVDEYLIDLNATQAAVRAGYSARTANEQGARLLAKVSVAAALRAAQAARSDRTKVDADWVLNRMVEKEGADIADIYDDSGRLRPIREWPAIWRTGGLVAGIEAGEERDETGKVIAVVRKVKLADRNRWIELIGKHVNVQAFRDQLGLSSPTGGPVEVNATLDPAEAYRLAKEF